MDKTHLRILGLDLGTSSIGWCLGEPAKIVDMGVRIFPEGMDRSRGEKSLNQDRRLARSIRRQTCRRRRRKEKLKYRLIDFRLLPDDEARLATLFRENPYALRARALEERLEPWQLGRALYHLGQRRGYKSNRKAGKEKDGKVKQGITAIEKVMRAGGFSTLGAYLNSLDPHQQRIRGRYTAREMYEHEFEQIWAKQEKFYPELLDIAARKKIFEAIFFQRPLRIQRHLVGECSFEQGRKRAATATLIAQEFRLWSSINNLKILPGNGMERFLTDKERRALYGVLKDEKQLGWEKVRGLLDLFEADKINLEKVRKSGMLGNQTVNLIKPVVGAKRWEALTKREKEALINDLIHPMEDCALNRRLIQKWEFDAAIATKLIKKSAELPKGYMRLSQKAMRAIVHFLEFGETGFGRGYNYAEACEKAGYEHTQPSQQGALDRLPFPGVNAKKRGQHTASLVDISDLRNPMVERALFQVRKVVNAIISEYGKPDIIRIEMARDLKRNAKQRKNLKEQQEKNEAANLKAEEFLKERGIAHPIRSDKLKYRLWKECNRVCPYSGNAINYHDLFTQPIYEIEHIIPYSLCLNDSYMNKTLCRRNENRRKRNQTPWKAFHGNEAEYTGILQRARKLPYPKFRRFGENVTEYTHDFVSQQLNETRYIAVKTKEYLEQLGIAIQAVKGGTTALLRRAWGLNNILDESGEKTRLDHRHHSIDALVVAYTSLGAVQKINTHASTNADGEIRIKDYPPPTPDMRKKVEAKINDLIVSHKSQRKIKGVLHKEFLYSLTSEVDERGIPVVAIRKRLAEMKAADLEHIRDDKIRALAVEHLNNSKNYGNAFKNPDNPFRIQTKTGAFQKIHKVRLVYHRTVTSIGKILKNSNNKQRNVWTQSNHHIELVEYSDRKNNKKWRGYVVSVLEATLRNATNGEEPVIKTDFEGNQRFLVALHQNDMVSLKHKGQEKICRVQKMDINQNIVFRVHFDADIKNRQKQIKFSANTLKEADLKLLEINPIGKIVVRKIIA